MKYFHEVLAGNVHECSLASRIGKASSLEIQNDAAELKLRIERKAGELLREMEKAKEAQGNPRGQGAKIVRSPDVTAQPHALADLGITKKQSSHWQLEATLPQETFDHYVETTKAASASPCRAYVLPS